MRTIFNEDNYNFKYFLPLFSSFFQMVDRNIIDEDYSSSISKIFPLIHLLTQVRDIVY